VITPRTGQTYRDALAAPHQAYTRFEVWRGTSKIEDMNPLDRSAVRVDSAPVYTGGSVRATLNSRVTRQLSMTVPDYLYPFKATDLLNPYGTELRGFRGLRYGDGSTEEFPIFVGPIIDVRPSGGGSATLSASDRAYLVAGNGFPTPQRAGVGSLVLDEFERVVLDALPSATFGTSDALTEVVPELSYDQDRGQALDQLAKTASAFWYDLADGSFVLRRVPWTQPQVATFVLKDASDGTPGTVQTAFPQRSAQGIYSRVTVTSESPDGGPPTYFTADDVDPTSPTYIGGPFGIRSATVRTTTAANQGQVKETAETLLRRARALTEPWQVTCVPDGSLELGDAFTLLYKGYSVVQVVAGLTMPLETTGNMTIDGRSLVPGEFSV